MIMFCHVENVNKKKEIWKSTINILFDLFQVIKPKSTALICLLMIYFFSAYTFKIRTQTRVLNAIIWTSHPKNVFMKEIC